jgi:hypothetical protein
MEMKRLNATGLRAAGYDEGSRTLVVETTSGTWEYLNVSPEIYRRLMNAPSPASFYRESIEDEEYSRRRISGASGGGLKPDDVFK